MGCSKLKAEWEYDVGGGDDGCNISTCAMLAPFICIEKIHGLFSIHATAIFFRKSWFMEKYWLYIIHVCKFRLDLLPKTDRGLCRLLRRRREAYEYCREAVFSLNLRGLWTDILNWNLIEMEHTKIHLLSWILIRSTRVSNIKNVWLFRWAVSIHIVDMLGRLKYPPDFHFEGWIFYFLFLPWLFWLLSLYWLSCFFSFTWNPDSFYLTPSPKWCKAFHQLQMNR